MPAFAPTSAVQGIWQLEQIYIGYYGRAVEASGYSYWQNEFNARTNGTYKVGNVTYPKQAAADAIASIAASFAPQSESIALYPFLGSSVTFPTTDIAIRPRARCGWPCLLGQSDCLGPGQYIHRHSGHWQCGGRGWHSAELGRCGRAQ